MKYFGNAFSLGMLGMLKGNATLSVELAAQSRVSEQIPSCVSCIGHADLAAQLSSLLGVEVKHARVNVELVQGDTLFVAQYKGPRLPEGTTVLPAGASFVFFEVNVAVQS